MGPPRVPPNNTVALCGVRSDASKPEIVESLKKAGVVPNSISEPGISNPMRDKTDLDSSPEDRRMLVWLNCQSHSAAQSICAMLNMKKNDDLGIKRYGSVLQAVLKPALSSVDWQECSKAKVTTVEGAISRKTRTECHVNQPFPIMVSKDVFEGSESAWNKLKVGDVLRMTAEEDKAGNTWRATEAAAVHTSSRAESTFADQRAAKAQVMEEAEEAVCETLTQYLRGMGWVSLETVGGCFSGAQSREMLAVVKTRHKQLKNFIATCPAFAVRQGSGGKFEIGLEAEVVQAGSAKAQDQALASMSARAAVAAADVTTQDETADEREGRARSYRVQRLLLELAPKILDHVLRSAWRRSEGSAWDGARSGKRLRSMVRDSSKAMKRVGAHGLTNIEKGQTENFDMTLLCLVLLDDPGLLKQKDAAHKTVRDLRSHRNDFVHSLHSQPVLSREVFDSNWKTITGLLGQLAEGVGGGEAKALLSSETGKILQQGVDARKEQRFDAEFERVFESLQSKVDDIDDRVGGVQDRMGNVEKRMVTMSVVDKLFEKKMQAMALAAKGMGPASGNSRIRIVRLNENGQDYSYDEEKDRVGSGSYGAVYKASASNGTLVALKVSVTTGSSQQSREYCNLKQIRHPSVVGFVGTGELGGKTVIAMEFVVGMPYNDYIESKGGKLHWRSAAEDFRQMIEGMQAVHALGIVHRDLKPENVMRKMNGRCIIVDFGLSKATGSAAIRSGTATVGTSFKGTMHYGAPESLGGQGATAASDVYSLGLMFYEAVSSEFPFSCGSQERATLSSLQTDMDMFEFQVNKKKEAPKPLTAEEAPPSLSAFVMQCLVASPARRFPDAGAMLGPWDKAVSDAGEAELRRAESGVAQRLWGKMFGNEEEVRSHVFVDAATQHLSLPPPAAQALARDCDADGNGGISRTEFLQTCGLMPSLEEIREKYAARAAEGPSSDDGTAQEERDGVYYQRQLVLTDVSWKSRGTMLGGKKQRSGELTLTGGNVVARRIDGASRQVDYTFSLKKAAAVASSADAACVTLDPDARGGKPRDFRFASKKDCETFVAAFEKTKAWIVAEVN